MNATSVVVLAALLSFSTASVAQWRAVEKVDAMTDEKKKIAMVDNAQGHSFSIYRLGPDGAVWGNFALSERSFDQLAADKPPLFRVDKHEPFELSKVKRLHELGIPSYEWEPKWVNFLIWHGDDDKGRSTDLVQLMEGSRVVFRYYLFTGGYKDTEFSLAGAAPVIAGALGISQKADAKKQAESEDFRKVFVEEMNKCKFGKGFKECSSRLKSCADKAVGNTATFKTCTAQ